MISPWKGSFSVFHGEMEGIMNMKALTEEQKETLNFYTTNDYLLINGLMWGEDASVIDKFIHIINDDGRCVMQEALSQGFDVRWHCSKEDGEKLFNVYQKRFPVIDHDDVKNEIITRAKHDIENMKNCLEPLTCEMVLYRNIKVKFIKDLKEGQSLKYLGFSSCSLEPHTAENHMYGAEECTLFEIKAPAGMPAIRLDLMKDIQNEPDEIILSPMEFYITKIDKENDKIYMDCKKPLSYS